MKFFVSLRRTTYLWLNGSRMRFTNSRKKIERQVMLTNEQINEAAKKWCEQQGIDPNGMSNSPRDYAVGYQAHFKPMLEAVADEMRRIEKEDSMRRFLTDYQNSIAPIGDNSAIGRVPIFASKEDDRIGVTMNDQGISNPNTAWGPKALLGYLANNEDPAMHCAKGPDAEVAMKSFDFKPTENQGFGYQAGKVRYPSTALGSNSGVVDPNPNTGLDSSVGLSTAGCCVGFVVRDPVSGSHSVYIDNKKKSD
jgi:hypothetical protein